MIEYRTRRQDVTVWPDDDKAIQAVETFFEQVTPGNIPILEGGGLDFSDSDLSGMDFAGAEWTSAILDRTRTGMRGVVDESVDVGLDEPHIIDGEELQQWFRDHGAPEVTVVTRPAQTQRNT
nr:hypothetical protein [Rhodococcus sp. 15-1154-1]